MIEAIYCKIVIIAKSIVTFATFSLNFEKR